MDSYFHCAIIVGRGYSDYDETIGDHVFNELQYMVGTRNITKNVAVNSGILSYKLPTPDLNNFIPGVTVTNEDRLRWLSQGVDIVALQNANIAKIEEIIAAENL